jgi:hypothetical protein
LVDNVISSYRERFGENLSAADPGVLRLGAIDLPPQPSRYRRPTPTQPPDEEYFADRGYLS